MQEAEPEMLAASLRVYPLVAVLLSGGLLFILLLRRKFKLDKALDDPARIAAIEQLVAQEPEREMSLKECADGPLGHLAGEILVWVPLGLAYLAAKPSVLLSVAVIVCWGLLLVLILRRVFK